MTLCISLSARPSNNGTRFHNHLYDQLGLNWIYKAFAPTDLAQAIAGVRGLGIRGCAVSMPYKEDVIALVDAMDPSAKAIDSVNTIVNDGGRLTAYNTDYTAIEQLLQRNAVPAESSVLLKGAGGMAKATAAALRDAGFKDVTIIARNEATGRALADLYGFAWRAELGAGQDATADMVINVTPWEWPGDRRPTRCPSPPKR
jgi:shikimate dehydrogenase